MNTCLKPLEMDLGDAVIHLIVTECIPKNAAIMSHIPVLQVSS